MAVALSKSDLDFFARADKNPDTPRGDISPDAVTHVFGGPEALGPKQVMAANASGPAAPKA